MQFLLMGLMLIISVGALAVFSIIGLFVGNIIMFESIGFAIAAGCLASHFTELHPAFCLFIGIGAFFVLMAVMKTKFGFWVIGGALSFMWGLIVAAIVYDGTGKDMIWTYTALGLVTLFVMSLHLKAKDKLTT